ncbi:MAG TPA: hypothetical protein VLC46_17240 [Thermoanaerobaculia bacterium]|jgi:hypothetical protein|nr:hypothetical protein [Thermoanaerobaculia bacterium]
MIMVETEIRAASGKNANNSRWAGLRLRGSDRQSWARPLQRTCCAIDTSFRLLDSSRTVIDACESFAGERPIGATRQLECVWGWLANVAKELARGAAGLDQIVDCMAQSPEDAGDAPERLIEATSRWIEAAALLAALSNRLEDTFSGLVDYVKSGAAPLDLDVLFRNGLAAPRTIAARQLPLKLVLRESSRIFCIHIRRQRSVRVTVMEAPRRIFRGRAPPSVSTCSL